MGEKNISQEFRLKKTKTKQNKKLSCIRSRPK